MCKWRKPVKCFEAFDWRQSFFVVHFVVRKINETQCGCYQIKKCQRLNFSTLSSSSCYLKECGMDCKSSCWVFPFKWVICSINRILILIWQHIKNTLKLYSGYSCCFSGKKNRWKTGEIFFWHDTQALMGSWKTL